MGNSKVCTEYVIVKNKAEIKTVCFRQSKGLLKEVPND